MKALLLDAEHDFDAQGALPPSGAGLTDDLGLELLFRAMAQGDDFVLETVRKVVLSSLVEPDAIRYRQRVLEDCTEQAATVRELYELAGNTLAAERKIWGGLKDDYPDGLLNRTVIALELLSGCLEKLRRISDRQASRFRSEGFCALFGMLSRQLDDDFLSSLDKHVRLLSFKDGVSMSVVLGEVRASPSYVLLEPRPATRYRFVANRIADRIDDVHVVNTNRSPGRGRKPGSTVSPLASWMEAVAGTTSRRPGGGADYDHSNALSDLRGRGISSVAVALASAVDQVLAFLRDLRYELAFFVGCLNLHEQLVGMGQTLCTPEPLLSGDPRLRAQGLYDVCLSLSMGGGVVPNDFDADGRTLVMITGANRGGKSTFLRSIGQAQLMMQCGMFVAAAGYRASVCPGLFTHFMREEDSTMKSGRLDEELSRMREIVDAARPGSMLLANESFASTNEREGSQIARQIIPALTESGVRVLYVTHFYDLAHGFYVQHLDSALFLRAQREDDARRTFKVVEAEPLTTSYGEDLYWEIFNTPGPRPAEAADQVGSGSVEVLARDHTVGA
jgi:hypothetical protein